VVELDAQGAAQVPDRHRLVEPAVLDPQVVEHPQRRPGEVAELGVVPLALELGDDDDRQHHLVLGEAVHRARVGEQDRGVEHIGTVVNDHELRLLADGRLPFQPSLAKYAAPRAVAGHDTPERGFGTEAGAECRNTGQEPKRRSRLA
jgi:hypothetical protein